VATTRSLILVEVGAVAAPLILVLAVRSLMTPAPSMGGTQAYDNAPAAVLPVVEKKLLPEQVKALDWIAHIGSHADLRSPMAHPDLVAPAPIDQHDEPTPEPIPATNPLAGVKLTGIIGTSEGGLAAVNGRIYKIGETVRPGLVLARINARANLIVLKAADGTEVTIRRRQ
jgi:hypothetical protein